MAQQSHTFLLERFRRGIYCGLLRGLLLTVWILTEMPCAAYAQWQLYRQDKDIIASVNYLSHESFHNQPSVWVRWHYVTPQNGLGGIEIQFTANCKKHQLFEIASQDYDVNGNFVTSNRNYDKPREVPIDAGSLNDATFRLLCGAIPH